MTQSGRYLILVLNPGSTSTKVGLFEDDTCVFSEDVFHDSSVLLTFPTIQDQLDFRMQVVESFLIQHQVDLKNVDAFVGRGGPCHSVEGGVYAINDLLIQDTIHCVGGLYHASLLGVLMADRLQKRYGGLLLMVDPPVVDELCDLARVTGIRGVYRRAISHALNLKATARFHAESLGRRYEDMNLIVCHIDGGISITAHEKGRMIDGNNAGGGEGPLSPTRMGSLAVTDLLLFLKKHSTEEVRHLCSQSGGFSSHFGTSDTRQIHRRMEEGDGRIRRGRAPWRRCSAERWTALCSPAGSCAIRILWTISGSAADSSRTFPYTPASGSMKPWLLVRCACSGERWKPEPIPDIRCSADSRRMPRTADPSGNVPIMQTEKHVPCSSRKFRKARDVFFSAPQIFRPGFPPGIPHT